MKSDRKKPNSITIMDFLDLAAQRWYVLFGAAVLGAVLGLVLSILSAQKYQSVAVVLVDHNAEEVMSPELRKLGFRRDYFMEEQTRLLEEISVSDVVVEQMSVILSDQGLDLSDYPDGLLEDSSLPHPAQGSYRFTVLDVSPEMAAKRAQAWAEAFIQTANEAVAAAQNLRSYRAKVIYKAHELAERETRCQFYPEWITRMEALVDELEVQAADSEMDADLRLYLEEVLEQASVASIELSDVPESNAEGLVFIQTLIGYFEYEMNTCDQDLALLLEELEQETMLQIRQEEELGEMASGFDANLEVQIKRAASIPTSPVSNPARPVLVGCVIGVLLGCGWMVLFLLRKKQEEGQA